MTHHFLGVRPGPTVGPSAAFSGLVEREGFELLAISAEHGIRVGLLPGPHKDPFDRMLIAQAQAENIPIALRPSGSKPARRTP